MLADEEINQLTRNFKTGLSQLKFPNLVRRNPFAGTSIHLASQRDTHGVTTELDDKQYETYRKSGKTLDLPLVRDYTKSVMWNLKGYNRYLKERYEKEKAREEEEKQLDLDNDINNKQKRMDFRDGVIELYIEIYQYVRPGQDISNAIKDIEGNVFVPVSNTQNVPLGNYLSGVLTTSSIDSCKQDYVPAKLVKAAIIYIRGFNKRVPEERSIASGNVYKSLNYNEKRFV